MEQTSLVSILPFNSDQKQIVESLFQRFDDRQLTWLAGYLTGLSLPQSLQTPLETTPVKEANSSTTISVAAAELTVLYGSRTGNGASIAKKLKAKAEERGLKVHFYDTNDYALNKLKDEKNLVVIVSTHGDGIPPSAAEEFFNYIHGKRAPKLDNTHFSVLALGDSGYIQFCKAGRDIDKRLEELGAKRFADRVDCDVDFEAKSDEWIDTVLLKLAGGTIPEAQPSADDASKVAPTQFKVVYNRQNPFRAKLLEKLQLNGRGSEKETWHYEISLEGSGLTYEPGDALGVFGVNSQRAVFEVIQTLQLNPDEQVDYEGNKLPLEQILTKHVEISTITTDVLKNYNQIAKNEKLTDILADTDKLKQFLFGRDVVDLVSEFPTQISAIQLIKVLRKLQPRLYSISSSLNAHPDEVHLTVAAVRYTTSRYKEGVCSTFLADRVGDDEFLHVFIEKNPDFRLPRDPETPVIMVGPGTGVAPFRAFVEERDASEAKGKNWLIYGDRNFTTDFLYQTEWQGFQKKGVLTKLNVAFSRDTDQKVYVQHKMQQHAAELFAWLENGAYFYVCGDMKSMWKDVHNTLIDIIEKQGKLSRENAEEYVNKLKKSKRYQVDVY